jgi:hypothetical protein
MLPKKTFINFPILTLDDIAIAVSSELALLQIENGAPKRLFSRAVVVPSSLNIVRSSSV